MRDGVAASLPAHGGQLHGIAARFNLPATKLLDFSASIVPGGPSPRVTQAIANSLSNPEELRTYPDLDSQALRLTLANYANVPESNILVGNGMVPLLSATLRAMSAQRCMLPVPAFGEYRRTLEREGVAVEAWPLSEADEFQTDLLHLVASCAERVCDTLLLTNPHNPTGAVLAATELSAAVQRAQRYGIRILIDEAFIDFIPQDSLDTHVPEFSNLIVFRSVTKFFAMASLRIAYMIAPKQLVHGIRELLAPWPISTLAAVGAIAAIEDEVWIADALVRNRRERENLATQLAALGLTVYPAGANFLFLRLGDDHTNRNVWERLILDHGIVVRNCATFETLDETYFRVAVLGSSDNLRLIRAFGALLNSQS
ncbi:MAG TPA: aminotransferase class I/II-fold pyridoxal phosphate-dependent enzyme [Acidobacteriaceae bacterium]